MLVSCCCDCSDIYESECGVRGRFDPDEFRFGGDVIPNIDLNLRCKGNLYSMRLCHLCEISVCSSIHIAHADNMTSGRKALKDNSSGGRARGECERMFGVLESCHGLLEMIAVGVGGSRIFVVSYGLTHGSLREGRREGDGRDDCAGGGVMGGACMDREGACPVFVSIAIV